MNALRFIEAALTLTAAVGLVALALYVQSTAAIVKARWDHCRTPAVCAMQIGSYVP